MADIQKNVEVAEPITIAETAPITTTETVAPVEAPVATEETAAPAAESNPAVEETTAEASEETKAEEKEEVKPIEEGYLGHKAQGLSFPKNLIPSKEFFFFGTDAIESKDLASYKKNEKSAETAQSNIAWASQTGKGLLFIGSKKAPTGIINLSDATEPETDGSNKFTLTSKGNKHSFKAASTAERDNWVVQLKLKITEAKELVATVTESETYKTTLESFKPAAPAKKEEAVAVAPVAEEAKPEEEVAKTEESPAEAATEETKAESPKPLKSKRASFFGFINKKDEVKEEPKTEETAVVATEPTPTVEESKAEETVVIPEAAAPVIEEAHKAEEVATPVESPKEKPTASKRNSFFGGVFSKKEKKVETKPTDAVDAPADETTPAVAETAPVIPAVESTTPLAVEVSSPATAPTETTEATPVVADVKKEKAEKRKSSLPFLGKREKSPAPVSEGEEEKKSSKSAFSKLRATIKGKTAAKTEDKPVEEATKEDTPIEAVAEAKKEETVVPVTEEPVVAESEVKPETTATTTPAVAATA